MTDTEAKANGMLRAGARRGRRPRYSIDDPEIRDRVLRKAMNLFWERGAETASYEDIVIATGLSRKALYQVWPDKDALVHDAIAFYRREVLGPMLELIAGGKHGLAAFWTAFEAATRHPDWAGCLLFRTASGPLRRDPFIAGALADHIEKMRVAIVEAVRTGQRNAEIDLRIDAEAAAWQCLSIAALVSTLGAQSGFDSRVESLITSAVVSCGLEAKTTARP